MIKHTLIYGNKRTNWDSWAAQYDVSGVEAAAKIHVDRSNLAIDAAVAGLGIVLESLLLANHAVATGALVAPLKQYCISVEGYYLVYPKSHAKIERVSLFRSWLTGMLEEKQDLPLPSPNANSSGDSRLHTFPDPGIIARRHARQDIGSSFGTAGDRVDPVHAPTKSSSKLRQRGALRNRAEPVARSSSTD